MLRFGRQCLFRRGFLPYSLILEPARGLKKWAHDPVLHTVMIESILRDAARLSDDALDSRLKVLALGERESTVEVVAHLSELDGRRSYLGEGPGSVCTYCREVLGYSEDAAWNRAASANVGRRFPVVLGWLADGTLNITTVRMLRPVLTAENHLEVLSEARGRSIRTVVMFSVPSANHPRTTGNRRTTFAVAARFHAASSE